MKTLDDVEILLVEDNPRDADLTLRALRKHNLASNLFHVKDGAEALDFLFATGPYSQRGIEHGPKVVLLDLKMLKVDGLEVLQKLKADERTRTIPVVVLTSSCEESDLVKSYELGTNAYVVKPVGFQEFVEAIRVLGTFWSLVNEPPSAPGGARGDR